MDGSRSHADTPISAVFAQPVTLGRTTDSTKGLIGAAGRFLIVLPMLIYPALHFVYTDFVASIVPPWIPWHYFWTYFTALSIFAAGLAILFKRVAGLASALLAIEIFLFCLLIHVPLLSHAPGDPWAGRPDFGDLPSRLHNAFKDFGLSGAVFLLAGSQSRLWRISGGDPLFAFGRAIVSISIAAFGVLHFVYPGFAPGIPPMRVSIAFPLPGHAVWVYGSAAAFLALAAGIWIPSRARQAALLLGAAILFFDLLTWVPVFVNHPMELTGNWLKDIGIAGGAWVLYGALASRESQEAKARA